MKIYVITGGYDYEGSYVLGVTLTRKEAEKVLKTESEESELDWIQITEWEVEK